MQRLRDSATWLAYAAVGFAAVGVTLLERPFVKLSVGPLYVLELVALVWLLLALTAWRPPAPGEALLALWPAALFPLWGAARLVADLIVSRGDPAALPLQRVFQHGLLFVYPAIWICVGFWCARREPRLGQMVFYLIAAAAIAPNLLGDTVRNVAVGPLVGAVFMYLLCSILRPRRARPARPLFFVLVTALAAAAFVPYWTAWLTYIGRTSLLLLLVSLALVPVLIRDSGDHPWHTLRPALLAGGIFLAGLLIAPLAQRSLADAGLGSTTLSEHFLDKLQHGEDKPTLKDPRRFRMGHRRFMWSQAIEDWRARPVVGLGFIPEVPSLILAGVPNTGGFEARDASPINGPHCSYLTILARTGLVGALLFALLLFTLVRRSLALMREGRRTLYEVLVLMVVFNGLFGALLHCGFESPHRSMVLWLAAGVLLSWRGGGAQPSS